MSNHRTYFFQDNGMRAEWNAVSNAKWNTEYKVHTQLTEESYTLLVYIIRRVLH